MKKFVNTIASITFFIISSFNTIAQSLDWLLPFSGEVNTGTFIVRQQFEPLAGKKCAILYTSVKTDKKGSSETTRYEFYISDIDENTVRYKASGKTINLEMNTREKQPFIKELSDTVVTGYSSDLLVLFDNPDKAREMAESLKKNIPLCKRQASALNDAASALQWLSLQIVPVERDGSQIQQQFSTRKEVPYMADFMVNEKDSKGVSTAWQYSFNLTDVDPAAVKLDIDGREIRINLPVKNNEKFIKNFKNNEMQNFTASLQIHASDLDKARSILEAFRYIIPLLKTKQMSFRNTQEAMAWLEESLGESTIGSIKYNQQLKPVAERKGQYSFISLRSDAKGNQPEEKYHFYLADLDEKATDIEVSGKTVVLSVVTRKKAKYIQAYKSGELGNYTERFEIITDDPEKARDIQVALNSAASLADEGLLAWTDKHAALDWIVAHVTDLSEGAVRISQKFSYDRNRDYLGSLVFTRTENGEQTTESFAFYLSDIDPKTAEINISGKRLSVNLATGKQKLVKVERFNQLQNFASSCEIASDDIWLAKNLLAAFNYVVPQCKPSERSWSATVPAAEWINQHIAQTTTGNNSIEQKIVIAEEDKCKCRFTAVEVDSKGVAREDVVEFNLADLDPNAVEFSVSGKEISITLNCKGKQKLMKPYKNGEVQNFTSSFKVYASDVMEARGIQEAFRSMAGLCGK
jgi:hypothetical protein